MKSKKIILLAVGIVTLYSMLFSMNANVMAQTADKGSGYQ